MAEKIVNGIGREIRYVEYRLRKKNGKSKKKTKNAANTFGGDIQPRHQASDYTDGSGSGSVSADMLEALPKDRTEESIQMQVALAMSKEESQEEQKHLDSDKIRLELAIKESLEKSKNTQQQQPQDTKQQSSDMLGFSQPSKPLPAANNDPWGNTVSQPSLFQPNTASVTSDPWGTTTTVISATAPQTQTQNAWGMPMPALGASQAAPLSQDPWGATSSQSAPSPVKQTAPQTNDPWGAPAPPQQAQSAFPVSNEVDAWGVSAQQQPSTQTNSFANSNNFANSSQSTDLFGAPATTTTMSPPTNFDPLHDFDNLRITDGNNTAASADAMTPIVLSSDSTSNIAFDILPLTDASNTGNNENTVATTKSSTLIDGTQGLVNLDNLLSGPGSTNPYYNNNMKSLSGNTNAFTPRTTQPSMNQMRGGNNTQAPFPVGNTQTPSFPTGNTQSAFVLGNPAPVQTLPPNALYPSLQMQSPMTGMYGQPANPMFGQQTNAMAPTNVNQTNLFLQ